MADDTKTCFIAMPVATTDQQAALYGDVDHWKHVLEELFVPAVEAAGFAAWRPIAKGSHMIHAEIVRQLEQADMVLCDISHDNPNVFFELGVRTSVNKPIALVRCDAATRIPFDVSGINTHTYDPSLKSHLVKGQRALLEAHLRDAEETCNGENPVWKQYGLELKAREPSTDVSAEDARISLLTKQVDTLTRAFESQAILYAPNNPDEVIWPADSPVSLGGEYDMNLAEFGLTFADLVSMIERIAEQYRQRVEVASHPKEGLKILLRDARGDISKEFRDDLNEQLTRYGIPFKVLVRPRDGSHSFIEV